MSSINIAIFFFMIYLLTIIISLRLFKNISPTIQVCSFPILIYCLGLTVIVILKVKILFFLFSSLYWFLTISLLMVFGAVYKSISLRMMLNLLKKPNKAELYEIVLKKDIENKSYLERVNILQKKNWIKPSKNQTFVLTERGRFFAKSIGLLQALFSIKESG